MEKSKESQQWYVVNTYAGHENVVKERLIKRIESYSLQDYISRVLVAEQETTEFKKGKEVKKKVNLFKGYLFIKMEMTDEAWFIVRNTPGVTGFIGSSGGGAKPFPVDDLEMLEILKTFDEEKTEFEFNVNQIVKVLDSPCGEVEGKIIAINKENHLAKVSISLFGKETEIDVKFYNIKSLD